MRIAALKLKATLPTEDQECQCLWQWAQVARFGDSHISDFLLLVPNGAYFGAETQQRHITMARLKRTGFRSGVFDYLLAIPKPPFAGLWIEVKRRHLGIVSHEQTAFQARMLGIGYDARIVKGWDEARLVIEEYLA